MLKTVFFVAGVLSTGTLGAGESLEDKLKVHCKVIRETLYPAVVSVDVELAKATTFYFYGSRCVSSDKEKMDWHTKGLNAAKRALKLLSAGDGTEKRALAHYYAAVNLSRWGQAKGILAALGRWDDVKAHLEEVIKNHTDTVNHGAHRTFGRAYLKLPFFKGGSKSKSEKYLKEAYHKTLSSKFGTSVNVLTTLYYLDTLSRRNKDGEFCTVHDALAALMPLDEKKATELNPHRVLETLLDVEMFRNPPKKEEWLRDVKDYADLNC